MADAVPIQPAATVVLLRDGASGIEALLLRRNSTLAFHGGAWVFPGGRVDEEDAPTGADLFAVDASRAAAAREAAEEAGVMIDPEGLLAFAHWTTPPGAPRRYATWFFMGTLEALHAITVDGGEIVSHQWATPQQALALQRDGEIELPPPTFVTLTRLASYATSRAAIHGFGGEPIARFAPRIARYPGGIVSLYEGDAGWADADPDREGPRHRLVQVPGQWRYERASA